MGFTIEKEYTARRGTQTAAQKEKRRRARKRASGRSSRREALKFISSPKMQAMQDFMGKINYGGMPNSTSRKPLSIDKEFRKKN